MYALSIVELTLHTPRAKCRIVVPLNFPWENYETLPRPEYFIFTLELITYCRHGYNVKHDVFDAELLKYET